MKYPKISVITPSLNQCEFLERTIKSVLCQRYPNLEYIIIDGGSSDGSVDIIRKYESMLTYWTSEPDKGQASAINKGLKLATGEWVAWQNSDDLYFPGAFQSLARAVRLYPDAELIIGNMVLIDEYDEVLREIHYVRPTYASLVAEGMLLGNQCAFWKRCVHAEIGYLDESLQFSFDYEWFLRLTRKRRCIHVNEIWGGFRLHATSKTCSLEREFSRENEKILGGTRHFRVLKPLFALRRALLLILQGDLHYVRRGLWQRITGKRGRLY